MNKALQYVTTAALLLSLTSCSLFSSGKQDIKIVTDDPNASITVNGEYIGRGAAVAKVKKNKSCAVEAISGHKRGIAVVDSELSTTGILDLIGGICFIIPFFGFLSRGAWELEQDTVPVHLH